MNLKVYRYSTQSKSILSVLTVDGKFYGHILEPVGKEIPLGTYDLGYRKEDTPLTMNYRERYDFFEYHIEIKNVPGRTGIYIHVGNFAEDSDGCLLIGSNANNNVTNRGKVSNSIITYESLYYDFKGKGKITIINLEEKVIK